MAFNVNVDLNLCQGYANCLVEASTLFDIDDDSNKAVVLGSQHADRLRGQAEAAVHGCPAQALTIVEL